MERGGLPLSPRGLIVPFTAPGKVDEEPPSLWAIICGVSDYRGASLDLRFAAKDAEDFATALRLGATRLFGEEHVHIQVLSTSRAEGTTRPTRASLEAAFEAARAARPDDVLVLYLAGHGVSQGGRDGDFHYLLADAATADLTDPEVRTRVSLSSRELTELVKQVPAAKRQVLILDTCASGRLIEKLTEGRNVPGSQIRALDRVKDRTGMFVLAGCAADRVSYEASRYGQGLLTYSLLLGMRGGALREDEYVDVARLFGFASDQVPRLASDIGGVQRPVTASPRGGASFDIGRIPADLKPRIPLEAVKPVFVRTSFQDERRLRDHLKLGHATNAVLRNVTTRGGGGGMVFVDAPDMPEAYEMTGRYTVRGETITVAVKIWRGNKEIVAFELTGKPDQIAALAAQIVGEARKHVR